MQRDELTIDRNKALVMDVETLRYDSMFRNCPRPLYHLSYLRFSHAP